MLGVKKDFDQEDRSPFLYSCNRVIPALGNAFRSRSEAQSSK